MKKTKTINYPKLIGSIVVCQSIGALGALFTTPAIGTWYADLAKPAFNPPNYLFGPVWTALYVAMGVAFYLVWQNSSNNKMSAYGWFFVQLLLNLTWSFLFFYLKSPLIAFIGIIALWVAILATAISFLKISKAASYLLIPYLLWVSFAAILNFSIWQLN